MLQEDVMSDRSEPPSGPVSHRKVPEDQTIRDLIQIVRGDYLDIPGLFLTRAQVQRLWGLEPVVCDKVLDALVSARFLWQTREGGFARVDVHCR
jgi:hypothetical protein